jgi:hypothetical protein
MKISKQALMIIVILVGLSLLITILVCIFSNKDKFSKLQDLRNFANPKTNTSISLLPESLNGVKRVYVSAGMFDLSENIYSIGIGGLLAGPGFSANSFTEVLCGFSKDQTNELKELCDKWEVPWWGIVGELEKIGWEAYCPVRDGFVMAPAIVAVSNMTTEQLFLEPDGTPAKSGSMFERNTMIKMLKDDTDYLNLLQVEGIELNLNDIKDFDLLAYMQWFLINSLSISIGANDLFAMYSSCNCCIFNFNGLQGDAGGLAEIGNLGARGVPISIIKSQITSDFAGNNNPMPTMAASSRSNVFPTLLKVPPDSKSLYTQTNSSKVRLLSETDRLAPSAGEIAVMATVDNPYAGLDGALTNLQKKVSMLTTNINNPSTFGNSNYSLPLPPLQAYWSAIGSMSYFMKHKSKSIPTTGEKRGHIDYNQDYTDFWLNNIVNAKDSAAGFLAFAKKCGQNVHALHEQDTWKSIAEAWK